jgi:hypothetical protein
VNAEDHISANANPIATALMSMKVPFGLGLSQRGHLNAMEFLAYAKAGSNLDSLNAVMPALAK